MYKRYKDIKPDSNQPARLYGAAKTHKFENLEDFIVAKLKVKPIIDQTGIFAYNAANVISDYLRPLCKNQYSINDTQKYLTILSSFLPLQDEKEDVSSDFGSLITNILIKKAINYITEHIYVYKKLTPICSKLIFKRFLIKFAA